MLAATSFLYRSLPETSTSGAEKKSNQQYSQSRKGKLNKEHLIPLAAETMTLIDKIKAKTQSPIQNPSF